MKTSFSLKIFKFLAISFLVVLLFLLAKAIVWSTRFMADTGLSPTLLSRLIFDGGAELSASRDRTNMLILGIGGGDHAGADLTDTIMLVSMNNKDRSMSLVSIPRDIWSESLKDKVNSAYHYGEAKQVGGGLTLAKATIEDVVGIPVHYALVIDFSGFKNAIDLVGGIDITVPKEFTDPDFPIAGRENDTCPGDPKNRCVYETIHFDAGAQHMDGERALKYVRSRHAEGDEGSDFARGKRQQDVLVALKDKIMHPLSWLNTSRIADIPVVIDEATDTDLNIAELLTVGKRFLETKEESIKRISLDDQLYNPPNILYGRYVLIPKEDWESVHTFIQKAL